MPRSIKLTIIAVVLSAITTCCLAAPSVQQVNENAAIDWTDHIYTARGEGVMPSSSEEPNRARAYLKAKGYARMAAVANLLMAIQGTAIDYQASGADYMADETIRQKIEGYVQNVETVNESRELVEGQTIVVVEVRAPMFGASSPAQAFLTSPREKIAAGPAVEPNESEVVTVANRPTNKVNVVLEPGRPAAVTNIASAKPSEPGRPYTSLIIDTTGYELDRCMSPKIRRADGTEVWGTVRAAYDFLQKSGIVAYVTSMAEAKRNSRCGSNPMVVKAVGRAGGKFHSDPVVSDADAKLIIAENGKGDFLDNYRVIFVKDGKL